MSFGLIYHDVLRNADRQSGFMSPDADSYKLPLPQFQAHVRAMRDAGVVFARCDGSGPSAAVTPGVLLTFDDGGASMADEVPQCLDEIGAKGHFFIVSDLIGTPGFVSGTELRALHAAGHVIGSHSCSHPVRMSALPAPALLSEWRDSREALEAVLGAPVLTASVPGGYLSPSVAHAAASAGYAVLHTSEPVAVPWQDRGLQLLGRFSIKASTPTRHAVRLASGARSAQWRDLLLWRMKGIAKTIGGEHWIAARRRVFATARKMGTS